MLEYINIDGTNLVSSRIALGTWAIGGWMWGGTDEKESIRTIHAALDQGINLIDTAPIYGYGRSEEIVGEALHQCGRRESVILATKVGIDWTNGKIERNSARQRILGELEDSLRRLQTDYIDIYQVHWPDPLVPVEETALTLGELYEQGKIRAIGISNYSPEEMARFEAVSPPSYDSAALQSLRTRNRTRCSPIRAEARNHRAHVRRTLPRIVERCHTYRSSICQRRHAQNH